MSLFNKKTDAEPAVKSEKPVKNNISAIVLLLLLAVSGYLYFFTSLIVPHEAPPVATPVATPQVKQPMPPRAETAAPDAGEVKKGAQEEKAQAAATPPPAAEKKPAAPAPPAAVQKPAPAAPAKAEAKPAPPAVQKPAPSKPAKAESKPVQAAAQKPAPSVSAKVASKPLSPAKKEEHKAPATAAVAHVKADAKAEKTSPATPAKKFTLRIGEVAAGDQLSALEAELVSLKIKPVHKNQTQKNRQMSRLFYKTYSDYDVSTAELEKLKLLSKGSFAIARDGMYNIYAGSFGSVKVAAQEKKRLQSRGVTVELQPVQLPVSSVLISAGEFPSKVSADKSALLLRKQGYKVTVEPKR